MRPVRSYNERIKALNFAMQFGGAPHAMLKDADVILVGVLGTRKVHTAILLGNKGLKVAHMPIVLCQQPDPEVVALRSRVVGLYTSVDEVIAMRHDEFFNPFRTITEPQSVRDAIATEIEYSRQLAKDFGWKEICITGLSLEEAGTQIIDLYEQRALQVQ